MSPCGRFVEFGVVGSRVWKLCDGEAMLISRKVRYFHGNVKKYFNQYVKSILIIQDSEGRLSDSDAVYLYPGFELGVAVSLERGKMVRGREATPARIKADRYVKLVNYLFIYPIYLISNSTFYPPGTGCRQWRWSTSRTRGCWSLRTRALTSQPRTVPSGEVSFHSESRHIFWNWKQTFAP